MLKQVQHDETSFRNNYGQTYFLAKNEKTEISLIFTYLFILFRVPFYKWGGVIIDLHSL